jgi:hypothetical protein
VEIKPEAFYRVSDLISLAISQISVDYMQSMASALEEEGLAHDLAPYARKMQHSEFSKPLQQLQAPGVILMYKCIELGLPFAYKLTRLVTTMLAGGRLKLFFQGSALLNSKGEIILDETNTPAVIFECYAIDTPDSRVRAKGTALEKLVNADTFDRYISELKTFGLQRLINICDIQLDRILQGKDVEYSCESVMKNIAESKVFANCLGGTYVVDGMRTRDGIIFTPCHIYVSTVRSEAAQIMALRANCSQAEIII